MKILPSESGITRATDLSQKELDHILLLDRRCREQTEKVIKDVATIVSDIQKRKSEGCHAYDTAVVEGSVILEVDMDNESLAHVHFETFSTTILTVNERSNAADILALLNDSRLPYGNWQGFFKGLFDEATGRRIKLSIPFYYLFDEHDKLTIEDIMQIRPEDIRSYIKIYI